MWLIIGVSGATCSGKSTLARSLHKMLPGSILICQDDFFLPVNSEHHTMIATLNHFNWEIMSSLDMEKMHDTVENILSGSGTNISFSKLLNFVSKATDTCLMAENREANTILNFADPNREILEEKGKPEPSELPSTAIVNIANENASFEGSIVNETCCEQSASGICILIIEGFLIFNDKKLADLCHQKYFITLTREQCWSRRSARTYDPADVPGYFEQCVWPEYEKHRDQVFEQVPNVTLLDGTLDITSVQERILLDIVQVTQELLQVSVSKCIK